jgi:hypothetical protein
MGVTAPVVEAVRGVELNWSSATTNPDAIVFPTVTEPVPPDTDTPEPATRPVTPVLPTVTFPVAPDTLTPVPATRPVTPALDKPRVVEPGTETKEIPPALERAFENTKLLAVGSETETPAPVAVLMFTVERALDRVLNCPNVGNKKEGTTPLTLVAVKFGSKDIYIQPPKISC